MRVILLFVLLSSFVLAVPFPEPTGYVMDTANILERDAEIEKMLAAINQESTAEIAVVTILTLENEDISTYSIKLAEHLKVGKADTDNGLIILIIPQDRQYRIEVGYGLEGIIPDSIAGRVGREIFVPAFQKQAYDQGVIDAIGAINGLLKQDPSIVSKYQKSEPTIKVDWFNILIFIAVLTLMIGSKGGLPFIFFPPSFPRGGSGGFGGGGFGGFGGGGFGGGGAGGRW